MADTVALVLDGEFAERVADLKDRDVWILASATNLDVVERLRRTDREFRPTTFHDHDEPRDEVFDEILSTVELHHGPLSQKPAFRRLEVFGMRANHAVRSSLERIGFELEGPTADGFVARRVATGS